MSNIDRRERTLGLAKKSALSLRALSAGISALAVLSLAPAHGQGSDVSAAVASDLDGVDVIRVFGARPEYNLEETSSATRTRTPLVDIPQAISVISADLIADQSMRSLADVVRYTPGVVIGQGEGHRDQLTIRGNNTTADFFIDGVRDDVQFFRPLYNLERVEVLRGPNALIFGRGGGGGIVNRVLKRPGDETVLSNAFSADTFGAFAIETDANAALGDEGAVRINAFYEELRNHRDVFEGDRVGLNPTYRRRIGERTQIDLSYEYLNDNRVVDRGVPSQGGRPLEGFRDIFFGVEGVNDADFESHSARIDLNHEFTGDLSLRAAIVYGVFDKLYTNVFPATAVTTNAFGVREFGIEAYEDPTERRNFFVQTDLVWRVKTGPFDHQIVLGGEFGDQRTANERINGFFDSGVPTTVSGRRTVVPLLEDFFAPPITFRAGPGNRSVFTEAEVYSAFIQDQVSIGRHLELIVGGRFDRFDLVVNDRLANARFERRDDEFSPRAGLVLKPVENASLYASYARSFLPQSGDQFLSLDLTLENLEPEAFENIEVGVKWDIHPRLSATAALYRLDRTNTRAPGPAAGTVVLTGAQRSRGFEASLVGELSDRWTVLAGYALQEAEVTQTTAAAPAGREVGQIPRHAVSVWTRYDFTGRFGAGVGVQHQSDSFATISNAVTLPAFTRVDAALFWSLSRRYALQVNVDNLLNADYFPTAHTDNNITTGAPRSARFTLRMTF